jgi:hypothetical protein
MDFDWPRGEIWKGYDPQQCPEIEFSCPDCPRRDGDDCDEAWEKCIYHPDNLKKWEYEPPKGEGYQLWETTSEGSPQSPVFKTLDELCTWCARNATTFGSFKANAHEWKKMLEKDFVHAKQGNWVLC